MLNNEVKRNDCELHSKSILYDNDNPSTYQRNLNSLFSFFNRSALFLNKHAGQHKITPVIRVHICFINIKRSTRMRPKSICVVNNCKTEI